MARKFTNTVVLLLLTVAALWQSSAATTYVVGDSLGWTVPPTSSSYSIWASNKTFVVGDILVFNFASERHDVAEVTKAAYDSCNLNNPISVENGSPARITLTTSGDHHFICTFPGHCNSAQKLSITVRGQSSPAPAPLPSSRSPAPAPSAVPVPAPVSPPFRSPQPGSGGPASPSLAPEPSSPQSPSVVPSPAPSRAPATYIVGDSAGWNVPASNGAAFYEAWARDKSFFVGDVLVFNFANQRHDVAEVTEQNFESCSGDSPISVVTNPPARITLSSAGEHFYICTIPSHCSLGQKLAINVTGNGGPSIDTPPSSDTVPSTPSPTTAPPPPNSATSLSALGFSATLLTAVIALIF